MKNVIWSFLGTSVLFIAGIMIYHNGQLPHKSFSPIIDRKIAAVPAIDDTIGKTTDKMNNMIFSIDTIGKRPIKNPEKNINIKGDLCDRESENISLYSAIECIKEDDTKANNVNGKHIITNSAIRVYAIGASILPHLEGAIYRLRHVLEEIHIIYIPAMAALREIHYHISSYPPHMKVLFDFFTNPNPGVEILGQSGPFINENHKKAVTNLQDYFIDKFNPEVDRIVNEINTLIGDSDEELRRPLFLADKALLIGVDKAKVLEQKADTSDGKVFESTYDPKNPGHIRRQVVLAVHLKKLVAGLQQSLGVSYYLSSYNLFGIKAYLNDVAMKSLKAAIVEDKSFSDWFEFNNTVTLKKRVELIRDLRRKPYGSDYDSDPYYKNKRPYEDFLTLKKNQKLTTSKKFFQDAAISDLRYHNVMLSSEVASLCEANPSNYFINVENLQLHEHETRFVLNKRKEVYTSTGEVTLTDFITKKEVTLNPSVLFEEKPMKDLISFLPTGFPDEKDYLEKGEDTFKWNYNYGKATVWPTPNLNGLLPGTNDDNFRTRVAHIGRHPATPLIGKLLALLK